MIVNNPPQQPDHVLHGILREIAAELSRMRRELEKINDTLVASDSAGSVADIAAALVNRSE